MTIESNQYIFIVGVGRSGTSLLHSMFAAHSAVRALPETSYLRRYVFTNTLSRNSVAEDKLLLRVEGLARKARGEAGRARRVLLSNYLEVTRDENYSYVLDKDPRLVEHISDLHRSFKGPKVIHIFRDPRDVLASKKKAEWSKGRTLVSYLTASRVQLGDARKASDKGEVFSVKYESLIKYPEAELKRLCQCLNFPYSEEMLDFSDAASKLVQSSEMSWKKETLRPIMAGNSNKWKNELTPVEAASAVMIVSSFCREHGYKCSFSSYSLITLSKAAIIALVVVAAAAAYKVLRTARRYLSYAS